ncbi:hypothetical protein MPLB_950037 [Mesorhizobium sp. ORS 3324]|nr:hypothetical protein MPLB_950037 [Mesorhizobium sp. ORS 3324]
MLDEAISPQEELMMKPTKLPNVTMIGVAHRSAQEASRGTLERRDGGAALVSGVELAPRRGGADCSNERCGEWGYCCPGGVDVCLPQGLEQIFPSHATFPEAIVKLNLYL